MASTKWAKVLVGSLVAVFVMAVFAPVGASSANISHSYKTDSQIPDGSLVSLDPSKTNYVESTTINNGNQLIGVSVAANDSLIAVDPGTGVQVATSGSVTVLVSTVNGDISVGDQVAVSPFSGIGMKAAAGDRIIGLAQTSFSSKTTGATEEKITDRSGKQNSVYVGSIKLSIGIGTASASGASQSSLQRFAKSLTGHTVSTARVILSGVILIVAVVALVALIYYSIYGSIISIGRNPLAKFAIFRTLGSVLVMALMTAAVTSVTIFFLLR